VAVAWHHALRQPAGLRASARWQRRLAAYAPAHRGVDASLLRQIEAARVAVAAGDLSLAPVRV
jgi:hypothetical protein